MKESSYTLHQGDLWLFDNGVPKRMLGQEIFDCLGLREGQKLVFEKAGLLQEEFQKKAEQCLKQRFPNKKVRVELIVYHLVSEKGKVVDQNQAYLDINLYPNFRENYANYHQCLQIPKECQVISKTLQKELRKELRLKGQGLLSQDKRKEQVDFSQIKKCLEQHYPLLKEILGASQNERQRIGAAWLLAWSDLSDTPEALFKAIHQDPCHPVHNNAGHALLMIAKRRRFNLEPETINELLKHPSTGCRNKAGFLLLKALQWGIIQKLPPESQMILSEMAQARQPNNREPAALIFQALRKKKPAR